VVPVVKLLSKRWWIPIGARQGLKLEPEGPRAGVGFPTTDQGFSSIQGTVWLSKHLSPPSMDECNDKMTVKDYIFTKHHAYRKIPKYKLYRNGKRCKKVPDLNCEVQNLLLEVVDLK